MGVPIPPEGNLDLRTDDGKSNYYYVWVTHRETGSIEHVLGEKGLIASLRYWYRETFPRRYAKPAPTRLCRPPGNWLLNTVSFFYSPVTLENIFEPLIADWRLEYYEALAAKRTLKAKWICVRYYWAFSKAMGLQKLLSVIHRIIFVAKSED